MVFLLDEFPAAAHRGNFAAAFHVVVIKNDVNVDEREQDEEPHERVMPLAHGKVAAHQRNDPGKEPWEPTRAHGGVQAEAGEVVNEFDVR